MIDEDAVIDKLIRIAPLAIGGFLLWKVVSGGLGSSSPSYGNVGQEATGQWDVEAQDPNTKEWNPWASYGTKEDAQTAANQLANQQGIKTRVVKRA